MKSKVSNILPKKNITWESSLESLYKGKAIPKSISALQETGVYTLLDLVWVFPNKFYPVKVNPFPDECKEGEFVRTEGFLKNLKFRPVFSRRIKLFNINGVIITSNGSFKVFWFNAYPNLKKKISDHFTSQESIVIEGPLSLFGQIPQLTNPKLRSEQENDDNTKLIYPTLNKVRGSFIEKLIAKIPSELWETMPELPSEVSLKDSLKTLHNIDQRTSVEKAVCRVKYQEFFLDQLKLYLRRRKRKSVSVPPLVFTSKDLKLASSCLPYQLTKDQVSCMNDIISDLQSGKPLTRLVQGDVGCGKTSIAIVAAKLLTSRGFQIALMAPTENLANQHYQNFSKYFTNVTLLTSSIPGKEKKNRMLQIENGSSDIIIGTHSLFQESIQFKNLGLSIIDEQHKFGVKQRIALVNKSKMPHFLLMTATPIPRTLRLSQYGDLDVSIIKEMPSGRKGYKTRVVYDETFQKFLSFLKTRLELGEQAYIVLPNIEKSETRSTHSLEEITNQYKKQFPNVEISPLHGKMPTEQQFNILKDFKSGNTQILISTTVVEVGIHVSNATVMAIYNPEMFGLSSLHQLRGRVGRDTKAGFCFLLALGSFNENQSKRLQTFEEISDGFKIAEADLEFRGEGNLFGAKQSGYDFQRRISHPVDDQEIFEETIEKSKLFFQDEKIVHQQSSFFNFQESDYINNYV